MNGTTGTTKPVAPYDRDRERMVEAICHAVRVEKERVKRLAKQTGLADRAVTRVVAGDLAVAHEIVFARKEICLSEGGRRSIVMISARCIVLEVRLALLLGNSLPARRARCPHRALTTKDAEVDEPIEWARA
jgi:hypothetical protein